MSIEPTTLGKRAVKTAAHVAHKRSGQPVLSAGARRCRRKFLRFFPQGFRDEWYVDSERDYKLRAHQEWMRLLGPAEFAELLDRKAYVEIALRAVRIESRTNLLFSFEKMALRDAVRESPGARAFATELFESLHGDADPKARFERWVRAVDQLPRKQTRVLTWPLVTVFAFLARPTTDIFVKPMVTRKAAAAYGFPFVYRSKPSWDVYANVLAFAAAVRSDQRDLGPRDMIDLQSFLWVQGSSEYD